MMTVEDEGWISWIELGPVRVIKTPWFISDLRTSRLAEAPGRGTQAS